MSGMDEWVEVQHRSLDVAVKTALQELGLESEDQADVEVVQDPQRGFLGMGGRDAIVRVKRKPKRRRRRRRRKGQEATGTEEQERGRREQGRQEQGRREEGRREHGRRQRSGRDGGRSAQEARTQGRPSDERRSPAPNKERSRSGSGGDRQTPKARQPRPRREAEAPRAAAQPPKEKDVTEVDVNAQASVVREFLEGLLEAFGLEGEVTARVDDGVVIANVAGEQTEALVGPKGTIMQAILDLCRTIVQRKTRSGVRMRLDIAGYGERRREALRIYATRLAEQVLEDGEEVMLEPMNPADRKVVHDAVSEIEGVRTYSEGEEPNRSVVLSLAPGTEPGGVASEGAGAPSEQPAPTEEGVEAGVGDSDSPEVPDRVSSVNDEGGDDDTARDDAPDVADESPESPDSPDSPDSPESVDSPDSPDSSVETEGSSS